jgi:REP element-mobilizing transposase RayT
MPRKARLNVPGIPLHVIQRANNREPCFFYSSRIEAAMNRQARLGQPGRLRSKNTQPER